MAILKDTVVLGDIVVTNKIIKSGGTANDILCADGSMTTLSGLGAGTVTSVGMTVPTGLSVSPASITSSGTFAITLTTGYTIPTAEDVTKGTTAHAWGDHATANYVQYIAQSLTDAQKTQARANIGAGTGNSNFSGKYEDLTGNVPTIPTVNNGTLTIKRNGTQLGTFTANQSGSSDIDIIVPTKVTDLSDAGDYWKGDRYWANIKVATAESKTTTPIFGSVNLSEKVTMQYNSSYKALTFTFN